MKNYFKCQCPTSFIPTALMVVGVLALFQTELPQDQVALTLLAVAAGITLIIMRLKSFSSNAIRSTSVAALAALFLTPLFGICISALFSPIEPALALFMLCIFAAIVFIFANKASSISISSSIACSTQFQPDSHEGSMSKILLDMSALEDGRVVDLARSGLLDDRLSVPRSLTKELTKLSESQDEAIRFKARKALESFKRIEVLPKINLEFFDLAEGDGDLTTRLIRTAKALNAYILSNETPLSRKELEEVSCISIDTLASALKPAPQRGEFLMIKILRLGKEPKQGVGYLDDGTMVVINGGGDFLGRNVRAQILSQKHSSTGKIIFCNVLDAEEDGVAFS